MDEIKSIKKMRVGFFGGAETVTGSNFLLETTEGKPLRILIDCGLFQGCLVCDDKNRNDFSYDPKSIDILVVTHAHLDHVGRIPKLVRDGFSGVIYSTKPTKEIADILLDDSLGILTKEAEKEGLKPIYSKEDIKKAMSLWRTHPYSKDLDLGHGVVLSFSDAGHILGSAMARFTYNNKNIVFTGDVGNSPAPLLRDTEPLGDTDYLVMESVYGDRNHEEKGERREVLEGVIEDTISRGGVLMVPAFSIERTQELLFEINHLVENNKIPDVPVFLDSPLA